MMNHDTKTVVVSSPSETMDVLAGVLRFGKSIRNRKGVLTSFLFIASLMGGAYFVLADRVYQSEGELMVLQTGANVLDVNTGKPVMSDRGMANYERMVKCDPVIRATLQALPHEHHRDLLGVAPTDWERAFRQRLSVNVARDTNIMAVTYQSSDPETAYYVLSTLFTEYVEYVNSVYEIDSENRLEILERELKVIDEKIDQAEQVYLKLSTESALLLVDENEHTNVHVKRVMQLNTELHEATSKRMKIESTLGGLETAIRNGHDLQEFAMQLAEPVSNDLFKKVVGVGSMDSYLVARLQEDIQKDKIELENLLENLKYGENHPKVRELRATIAIKEDELRNRPQQERAAAYAVTQNHLGPKLVEMARQRLDLALRNEQDIREKYELEAAQAASLNKQYRRFQLVKRELESLNVHRQDLRKGIAGIGLDREHGLYTTVLNDPQIVRTPVAPKLPLVVVVSSFLGFMSACATIYVLDLLDDRFRSPDDLRSQVGAPILTVVRRLPALGKQGIGSLTTYSRPNSTASESFRTLRAALDFTGEGARRLTISSTEPSDGKTTVLANLAVAFAQSGKRTLLIDGDMRRPGLTRLFERGGYAGLSTVLRDTQPIVDCVADTVFKTELKNLDVLPAGPRPSNPVELLTSERLSDLLGWAETSYDQVLIDAPPSLAVTDAAIIGRLVDGAVLTVRPEKNRRKLVLRATEALTSLGCELLGVVINTIEARTDQEYGYAYGHSDYGHSDADVDANIEMPARPQPKTVPDRPDAHATVDTESTIGIPRERSERRLRLRRAA